MKWKKVSPEMCDLLDEALKGFSCERGGCSAPPHIS